MNIVTSTVDSTRIEADALIFPAFKGMKSLNENMSAIDKKMNGVIARLISCGEIQGKLNEITVIHSTGNLPARIVAIAGLGEKTAFTDEKYRSSIAHICRTLRGLKCRTIAIVLDNFSEKNIEIGAQAAVEGSMLGLYTFNKYKTSEAASGAITSLIINVPHGKRVAAIKRYCLKGQILAEATMLTRDLVNEPSNYLTPSRMAGIAKKLANKFSLDISVLNAAQMKKLKMAAILSVAKGSQQPPKFIIMNYRGNPGSNELLGFVGKGITFDSGGISLKPSENMGDMKGDMAGGATVIAALTAISRLKLKINVAAFIPATENLPSGDALKPGDVIKSLNGKTIEIITTDAEGRLILADALSYAVKQKATRLIDVATLTGACHIALGDICSGIFSNNKNLASHLIIAGDRAGECMWQMPMNEEYKELNRSDIADIKNSGGRWGGAISAAQFLSEFVNDTPWVHIDIAGTSDTQKEHGYKVKGATGTGVRTLINLAEALADKRKGGK